MTEDIHQWENTLIVLIIRYGRACGQDDGITADQEFKHLLHHLRSNPARQADSLVSTLSRQSP